MKHLSAGKLKTILMWANHCEEADNFVWSKSHANLKEDVQKEVKYLLNKRYKENK